MLSPPQACAQGNRTSSCTTCSHCGRSMPTEAAYPLPSKRFTPYLMEDSNSIQCNMHCERGTPFMQDQGMHKKCILCAWHVDRAWRKALQQQIPEQKEQVHVYQQLSVLLCEIDEAKFRVTLQEFLTYTERYHYDFYKYFSQYYCKRIDQWASCYRKQTAVNTNMFVEAFSQSFKNGLFPS